MRVELVSGQKKHNASIFLEMVGYRLNYEKPETFNEKLNWLKFNYRDSLITKCSGKDTVREYVKDVLGERADVYLTRLVGEGVYEQVDEINWETLPEQFVLKINNSSGQNIICSDKTELDIEGVKDKLRHWMQPRESLYYTHFYEWGYKDLKPRIVCEEFLGDVGAVRDYKIFCFNGTPRFIYVSNELDMGKECIDMDYLTLDWKKTEYIRKKYKPSNKELEKPKFLKEMVNVATTLSKPFPFVRVDFFGVKERPKVAELTFYPSAGMGAFENLEHDYEIGRMLNLPKPKNRARFLDVIHI